MAFLKLSDAAFGSLGLSITESIDLTLISQQLSNLLGVPYTFDSLDVSSVTRSGLTATGTGAPGGSLTVGDYTLFEFASPVSGFEILNFTSQTIDSQGAAFDIRSDGIYAVGADFGMDFGPDITTLDFSNTPGALLDILIDTVAPFDTGDFPYGGYEVIGNAADNIFYGYLGSLETQFFGGDVFRAGDGNDGFSGGRGGELFEGGPGNDDIFGMDGDDLLLGYLETVDPGTDLSALLDRDLIFGGQGADVVDGGPGDDLIYASQGADSLTGGADRDRFVFAEAAELPSEVPLAEPGEISYDYVTPPFTGFGISASESTFNLVTDFTAGEDLLVMRMPDAELDSVTNIEYAEGLGQQGNLTSIGVSEAGEFVIYRYVLQDQTGQFSPQGLLTRVDQSDTVFTQQALDAPLFDNTNQQQFDASFEINYASPSQGSFNFGDGVVFDTFNGLQLTPTGVDGQPAGQDKFDLTGLDLGRNGVEAIEDILFTTPETGFSIQQFGNTSDPLVDFFVDVDAGVNRAVHVEFDPLGGLQSGAIGVYVDADLSGSFEASQDLYFQVNSPQGGDGQLFADPLNPLTSAMLYNDPAADGTGTGIFIFEESQYDLWFNDLAPPELIG